MKIIGTINLSNFQGETMKLIEKLEQLEKPQLNVFYNFLFGLNNGLDLLQLAKKNFQGHADLFNQAFPEKWWQTQFDKIPEINSADYEILENSISNTLAEFLANYTNNDKAFKEKTIMLRQTLKAGFDNCGTYADQTKGIPIPPIEKAIIENARIIDLPTPNKDVITKPNIFDCIGDRQSRRKFTDQPLSLAELSYLLWATQGVRKHLKARNITLRNVPSGGARQPFETYLFISKVSGLKVGIYHYLALEHKLVFLYAEEDLSSKVTSAALGQSFAGDCAVCFIWSAIPYRCEWRYTTEAKKIIAQDSGHLGQNLYLSAESIGCGTCALGAYSQNEMDQLLRLDGEDEFVIYVSPVGKV